jgi:hypothetical protein
VTRLFPGDRRVWLVGGAVLAAGLLLALVYLLRSAEHYTGTNSVGVRSVVGEAGSGERLCIRGLDFPDGSTRARLSASWRGTSRPELLVERRTQGLVERASLPAAEVAAPGGLVAVDVPIGDVDVDGDSAGGGLCLTPRRGALAVGGMAGLPAGAVAPTLAGEPVDARVSVRFLGPAGEEQSLLSLLPDAIRRAALFRPGIVAGWWYAAILLVLLPALWYVALRLIATRAAGEGRPSRAAVAIAVVATLNAAAWALITPAWHGPDEPDHFAYAQTVAERGETPDKQQSQAPPFSSAEVEALNATSTYAVVGLGDTRPPWLPVAQERYAKLAGSAAPEDDGGGYLYSTSTHLPGYYALTVPAYAAADSSSAFSELTAMRLVSALLAAVAALCAFLTVRELSPRRQWLAVTAGLLVAFQPMVAFMFGVVNNDAGVNAAGALLVFLLIRGLRRGLSLPLGLALGATLVALPAMKGTGAALYPAAALGVAGMLWRRHRRADLPGYAALTGAAALGLVARRLLVSALEGPAVSAGRTEGGASVGGTLSRALDDPATYVSYVWQMFLPRLPFMNDLHVQTWPAYEVYIKEGWAAFGWLVVFFPQWVYLTIVACTLAALILGVAAVWRGRAAARGVAWELGVLVVAVVGVIAGVEGAYFTDQARAVPAEQGRYVFTAIVPLAALAVGAALAFGNRVAPLVASALAAAVIVFGYASQLLALTWFFT